MRFKNLRADTITASNMAGYLIVKMGLIPNFPRLPTLLNTSHLNESELSSQVIDSFTVYGQALSKTESILHELTYYLECCLDFGSHTLKQDIFNELYYIKEYITEFYRDCIPVDCTELHYDICNMQLAGLMPENHVPNKQPVKKKSKTKTKKKNKTKKSKSNNLVLEV